MTFPVDRQLIDQAIADATKALELDPRFADAFVNRGLAYSNIQEIELAIDDFKAALAIEPNNEFAWKNLGSSYRDLERYDDAFAAYEKCISINPKARGCFNNRGNVYFALNEYSKAIENYNLALKLDTRNALYLANRARALVRLGDYDTSLKDLKAAIVINPNNPFPYFVRGELHNTKGEFDAALADFNRAIAIQPVIEVLLMRAKIFEARGLKDKAREDYRDALARPAGDKNERSFHAEIRKRLDALEAPPVVAAIAPVTPGTPQPIVPLGKRVALVIGNSAYTDTAKLPNTSGDARAIAASLRRLGFVDVEEKYDLSQAGMVAALRDFGDKAADADWAVIYYAGHGLEMSGTTYLLPTDVKLARDTHVADEAVSLERVISKVEGARKLRLVILDSCRNNPFLNTMTRSVASRAVSRGLGRVEPDSGVLVAYAAKHGTVAADGDTGANSPFAEALLATLEEPGLELNFLFRRVRDRVMERTGRAQEPFLYGSLSSENLYFKQ